VQVCIALDCATKPRLGENAINAASKAKLWINIDHHMSNPAYGDINHIDSTSPATGQILYQLIQSEDMPLPAPTRDAIYVAVSTDTGSFQYSNTTAAGIDGVVAAAFFEELEDGNIRVSLRAKDGTFNACETAQLFGGGGHARAAGIRMPGPISDARTKVLEAISKAIS